MIYLLLGTDLGDREANLSRARELLSRELGAELECSEVLETEAVGFEGPAFLNQIVAFDGDFEPHDLLHRCQAVEVAMGRKPHKAAFDSEGRRIYKPRVIDVDILHLNGVVMDCPELTIPHRQVFRRPFVNQILQKFTIPTNKQS